MLCVIRLFVYINMIIDICIYVYMYICIYVYMYICIYVYMYMKEEEKEEHGGFVDDQDLVA